MIITVKKKGWLMYLFEDGEEVTPITNITIEPTILYIDRNLETERWYPLNMVEFIEEKE